MNRSTTTRAALALLLPLFGALPTHAAITIDGADGSDAVLNVPTNTNHVIDLSEATEGETVRWDTPNTARAGKGVYDPEKWAVVFKYSSVTIASGATVTFKNHSRRAPVVWLVSGDVTINGTVSLNGANGGTAPGLAEPGPGGFRGGTGFFASNVAASSGFGVGGGGGTTNDAGAGSYGSVGGGGQAAYGNPSLIPLIGGSGGAGTNGTNGNQPSGGGAGGGAILIACATNLTVAGQIRANGGQGASPNFRGGCGSAGGIRLVAETLSGAGSVFALGGDNSGNDGGLGRIRIERVNNSSSATVSPDPSIVPLGPNATALIWPPSDAPLVRIVSIGGQNILDNPLASFGTAGADAVLPQASSTQVIVETTNVVASSVLTVRGTPRSNGTFVNGTVVLPPVEISPDGPVLRWTANLPVQTGYSAVQVKVVRP